MSDTIDLKASITKGPPPPPQPPAWMTNTVTLTLTAPQLAYVWALIGNASGAIAEHLLGDARNFSTYNFYLALDNLAVEAGIPTKEMERRNVDITIRESNP